MMEEGGREWNKMLKMNEGFEKMKKGVERWGWKKVKKKKMKKSVMRYKKEKVIGGG